MRASPAAGATPIVPRNGVSGRRVEKFESSAWYTTSPAASSTAYTHVRSGSAGWSVAVYLVPVSEPKSGTVVETAQSRAGRTSIRWMASVSPGSAPSTWKGPVWGLMNGYWIKRLGRSSLVRM